MSGGSAVRLGSTHKLRLLLEIAASKPPRIDLNSDRVVEMAFLCKYRSALMSPSKTKKEGSTPNAKCRKVDLYGEMGNGPSKF